MKNKRIKVRASSLSSFADCMLRGLAANCPELLENLTDRKIRRRTTRGVYTAVGTAVHSALAHALEARRGGGPSPSVDDCIDLAVSIFDAETSQSEEPIEWDRTTPMRSDAIRQISDMVTIAVQQVAPTIHPVVVESELRAVIDGDIVLTGHPDWIGSDGVVGDLKTGRVRDHTLQLAAYVILGQAADIDASGAEIVYIQRPGRSKSSEVHRHRVDAGQMVHGMVPVVLDLLRRIKNTVDDISADTVLTCINPGGNLCGEKWCPAYGCGVCPAHP